MREILTQFHAIWREIKPVQKIITLTILLFVSVALGYLILKTSSSVYVPLYPNAQLQSSEISKICTYLNRFSTPFKEDKKKGILVSEEYVDQIRVELAAAGFLDQGQGKGFELFDTNTWIKGEKELQVLEMRALKGQLEKDLAEFDHIKNASVILDIPPPRQFRESQYQTKASVILTLMPSARLSTSQLRAITYHLAGAVRGLESHCIAISDTTGKLYKAINPDGEEELLSDAKILFEENTQEKIDELLTKIVGKEHFYSTVQAAVERESNEIISAAVAVGIDESKATLKEEIYHQLSTIVQGIGVEVEWAVDFLPFEKKRSLWVEKTKSRPYAEVFVMIFLALLAFACLWPLFRRMIKKRKEDEKDVLFRAMTQIDSRKLAELIQGENPATIALMLSYLEPPRAEKIMTAFSESLQKEILYQFSELEKEEL